MREITMATIHAGKGPLTKAEREFLEANFRAPEAPANITEHIRRRYEDTIAELEDSHADE